MDLEGIIRELRAELQSIDRLMQALRETVGGGAQRRATRKRTSGENLDRQQTAEERVAQRKRPKVQTGRREV
jgi:hypothetical protein